MENDPEESVGMEFRLSQPGGRHGISHALDALADAFDLVQPEEDVRNELISSDRDAFVKAILRQSFRQASRIRDFHAVIVHFDADLGPRDAVVAMHEGVDGLYTIDSLGHSYS